MDLKRLIIGIVALSLLASPAFAVSWTLVTDYGRYDWTWDIFRGSPTTTIEHSVVGTSIPSFDGWIMFEITKGSWPWSSATEWSPDSREHDFVFPDYKYYYTWEDSTGLWSEVDGNDYRYWSSGCIAFYSWECDDDFYDFTP